MHVIKEWLYEPLKKKESNDTSPTFMNILDLTRQNIPPGLVAI